MRNRILTHALAMLTFGAAMLAAPAIAAAPAPQAREDAPLAPVSPPAMHPLPEPPPETVHPLAGRPDYGSAGAAFGASRSGRLHEGQDVFAPAGTPLVSVADATVVETGSDGGRGNYVAVRDRERDLVYVYLHMLGPATAKEGERVAAGERLGAVGCTGSCWGDHLHFEIRRGDDAYGTSIDPLPKLRDWPRMRGSASSS